MKRESRNEIEKGREHNEMGTHKYCNCPLTEGVREMVDYLN